MTALLFVLMFSLGVSQRTASRGDDAPASGSIEKDVYRNLYFGLSYRIPEGLVVDTMDFTQKMEKHFEGKPRAQTYVLLSAHEKSFWPKGRRIIVLTADHAERYGGLKNGGVYLRKVVRYHREEGFKVLRESAQGLFGGQEFFRADFKKWKWADLLPVYVTAVFTVRRGYAVGFMLAANTKGTVEELAESLNTLEFSEQKREPLEE